MRTVSGFACCVACVALAGSAAPQTRERSVAAYRAAVNDYREYGTRGVTALQEFSDTEVSGALDLALAPAQREAWTWEDVRAAIVLHTEATADDVQARRMPRVRAHLDAGARLVVELVRRRPEQKHFVDRWRTVTGALLRRYGASALGDVLVRRLDQSLFVQPSEALARKHFDDGVQWELKGGVQGVELSAQPGFGIGDENGLPSRFWIPAAREYLEAIRADATLLQAWLHLGRIRMLEGKLDEAVGHFDKAADAVDPRVRYLARLFSGSVMERRGRYGDAEARYRDAIAQYPWGQSGPLALAQIMSRTGREAEARATVLERLNRHERIVEPLWTYVYDAPENELASLFDELRVEVGK